MSLESTMGRQLLPNEVLAVVQVWLAERRPARIMNEVEEAVQTAYDFLLDEAAR
jgi:hypothetical protein